MCSNFNITTMRNEFQASLMNTIVRDYTGDAKCARIRILLTVNSLPAGAESFLANCQTPPNHELLIPTRPLYSNVLSRGSKIPEFCGHRLKTSIFDHEIREIVKRSSDLLGRLTFNS